jgi:hypothetical protein
MFTPAELAALVGKTVIGADQQEIGKVVDVYESAGDPARGFVAVSSRRLGGKASFVPLADGRLRGDELHIRYDKRAVAGSPRLEADDELSLEQEARLLEYYAEAGRAGRRTVTVTVAVTVDSDAVLADTADQSAAADELVPAVHRFLTKAAGLAADAIIDVTEVRVRAE